MSNIRFYVLGFLMAIQACVSTAMIIHQQAQLDQSAFLIGALRVELADSDCIMREKNCVVMGQNLHREVE